MGVGSTETLVHDLGPGRQLLVYQDDKVVATVRETDPGVPSGDGGQSGLEKIDVATWKSLAKFALKPIGAAARKRFADGFILDSKANLLPQEKQRCKASEWSVVRARDKKLIVNVPAVADHCLYALGGYVDESGKHALIKVNEEWDTIDDQELTIHGVVSYALVALP
jgi:hypothetical protein